MTLKNKNLTHLLTDMEAYCYLVHFNEDIIHGLSKYYVARMVREDLKQIYDLNKGDFNFYYRMYRGRLK